MMKISLKIFIYLLFPLCTNGQIKNNVLLEMRPFWKWNISPKHRITKDFIKNYDNFYSYDSIPVDSLIYLIGKLEKTQDTVRDARMFFCFKIQGNILFQGYFNKLGNFEMNGINYSYNKDFLLFMLNRIPLNEREKYYPYMMVNFKPKQ